MANTRSALKRMRQNETRRLRAGAVRSSVKTAVKTARAALGGGAPAEAEKALMRAIRTLDKAVTKGVLHKNAAARKKSRLARQLGARQASSSSP